MTSIEQKITLGYTDGTSDKIYIISLVNNGDGSYSTMCDYGRRGYGLKRVFKAAATDRHTAIAEYNKVYKQKIAKGYIVEDITALRSTAATTAATTAVATAVATAVVVEPEVSKTESLTCSEAARAKALERLRRASA
jgi:heptaprenylglyceryl phosphate synthase